MRYQMFSKMELIRQSIKIIKRVFIFLRLIHSLGAIKDSAIQWAVALNAPSNGNLPWDSIYSTQALPTLHFGDVRQWDNADKTGKLGIIIFMTQMKLKIVF